MGNFCKSHPCDTVMYSTGVMNLWGVVDIMLATAKFPRPRSPAQADQLPMHAGRYCVQMEAAGSPRCWLVRAQRGSAFGTMTSLAGPTGRLVGVLCRRDA